MLYKRIIDLRRYINIKGRLYDLGIPRVMGIINITPDSFYNGSRASTAGNILAKTDKMIAAGADIIDIGGYSSRPGADEISQGEENDRVSGALEVIRSEFPDIIISLDTYRARIVESSVRSFGVDIINDISCGSLDPEMHDTVIKLNIPYILMHMAGTPKTMQDQPSYANIISDLLQWFAEKTTTLVSRGLKDIIIDPGFGFGKNIHQWTPGPCDPS